MFESNFFREFLKIKMHSYYHIYTCLSKFCGKKEVNVLILFIIYYIIYHFYILLANLRCIWQYLDLNDIVVIPSHIIHKSVQCSEYRSGLPIIAPYIFISN